MDIVKLIYKLPINYNIRNIIINKWKIKYILNVGRQNGFKKGEKYGYNKGHIDGYSYGLREGYNNGIEEWRKKKIVDHNLGLNALYNMNYYKGYYEGYIKYHGIPFNDRMNYFTSLYYNKGFNEGLNKMI